MSEVKRPSATQRKEVVETATFGALCIATLKASQRLLIADVEEIAGEPVAQRARRAGATFLPRLMHQAVTDPQTGDAVYDAEGWDVQLGEHGAELDAVVAKALAMNGFAVARTAPDGSASVEDASKND